jgi:MFS family permease
MPKWRKIVFIVLVSVCEYPVSNEPDVQAHAVSPVSSLGLALVSGFGGLLAFYIPIYSAHGATYADITALMTYPSMFMGVGNLICMPLALAIGRRPVYLGSLLLLIAASVWAARAKDYNEHLGARMLLGFAAGQSEALVPMMIQEIHFVHERSTFLMWQSATQTVLAAVLVISASPIAGAVGPENWYILGAGLCATTFIFSIVWVPESRYNRPLAAYGQFSTDEGGEGDDSQATAGTPVRISERPTLDTTNFLPRTVWSDMRVFVGSADWIEGWYGLVVSCLSPCIPQKLERFAHHITEHFSDPVLPQCSLGLLSQRFNNVSEWLLHSTRHQPGCYDILVS